MPTDRRSFLTSSAIHRMKLLHCFPNFIPGLHQIGDTPDIAALIAPRALHLNFGETDHGSPIQEVRSGVQAIAVAYKKLGAAEKFTWFIEDKSTMWTSFQTMSLRMKMTFPICGPRHQVPLEGKNEPNNNADVTFSDTESGADHDSGRVR